VSEQSILEARKTDRENNKNIKTEEPPHRSIVPGKGGMPLRKRQEQQDRAGQGLARQPASSDATA